MTTDLGRINSVLGAMPYLPASRRRGGPLRAGSMDDVVEILGDLADYLADVAHGHETQTAEHQEMLRDIEGMRRLFGTGSAE